jgi:hypothetical protein
VHLEARRLVSNVPAIPVIRLSVATFAIDGVVKSDMTVELSPSVTIWLGRMLIVVGIPSGCAAAAGESSSIRIMIFVLITSGCSSSTLFNGFQPRRVIAHLLHSTHAKDRRLALFARGRMSVLLIATGIPILVFKTTNSHLYFVVAIFQEPFCSAESPTCHRAVPLGRH